MTSTLDSALAYLPQLVEAQLRHHRTPGAQVAVRTADGLVASFAVGFANTATGEKLRTDHLFRIASHSKTFTGTAVLQLVERGAMRLDDRIAQYVPELEGHPLGHATLRELLGHQSGVQRDGSDADFWQLEFPFPDRAALLEEALAHGKVFERNEHFKYSNVGYSLLGLAIETASGLDYASYCRENICAPLGLENTGAEYEPARASEFAAGHTGLLLGESERLPMEHVDTRAMAAATGFYSTAEDLTAYGAAHALGDDRLLSDDSKRIMQRWESTVKNYGTEIGSYGVGMEVLTIRKRRLIGHSGGYPGMITRTYIDPAEKIVISVLTNSVDGIAQQIAQAILAIIDAAQDPLPGATVPEAPAGARPLSEYTGRFASLWGLVDIVELGGRLVSVHPTVGDVYAGLDELEVVDRDSCRIFAQTSFGATGELIRFVRDADGVPTRIVVNGMSMWPVPAFLERRESMTHVVKDLRDEH